METHQLMMTALRGVGVYVLMLCVVRLMGKRTIGNFTAFDFLVALMVGEVVDEMIYGDVTFLQGTVSIVTVAAAKYLTSWLDFRVPGMNKLLEGTPTKIIDQGKYVLAGMRKELMNEAEVLAVLRLNSILDPAEVNAATVENDGKVSIIREEWAQAAQKIDLKSRRRAKKKRSSREKPSDRSGPA